MSPRCASLPGAFAAALALAYGCSGSGHQTTAGASSDTGSSTTAGPSGTGQGGSAQGGAGGHAGGTGGHAGGAGGAATTLSFPQLVHGAARVDTAAFASIPLVVGVTGATPDGVNVAVDGAMATPAVADGEQFVATLTTTALTAGSHAIVATATSGGTPVAMAQGTLVVADGSLQFTEFAQAGPAYDGHLSSSAEADALSYSWVSVATGKHQLYLNQLDGAFRRLSPTDVVLNDPADEPLAGYTAFGQGAVGAVYTTAKPGDSHWLVKMRVVDPTGQDVVPTMDLTQGEAAFSLAQAGVDPGGFSGAWLHIRPSPDPSNPLPVEVRFARYDLAAQKLVGPLVLDSDQPQAPCSTQGPQSLEPLAELGIACNTSVCLVTYSRDVYNAFVDLNIPKLFVAVVDLTTGALAGPPTPVEATDWDTQMFGQNIVAQADGSFVLVYTANDTAAAVTPITPCDNTLERDLLYAVKIGANGALSGTPKPIFNYQGPREYPRIAPHPEGYALFWEDQRSECNPQGFIRMAMNVAAPNLGSLLDPYLEAPGSIALPPEDPTLAVTGTSFVVSWSDNRNGDGLAQPEPEIYFETYWRK
jgi:hypothetical protein